MELAPKITRLGGKAHLCWIGDEELPQVWPAMVERLRQAPAVWDGYYTEFDLYQLILAGKLQLFTAMGFDGKLEMFMITAVEFFPQRNVLHIIWLGGENVAEHKDLLKFIEEWAHEAGVQEVQIYGRKGWSKVLEKDGYKEAAVVIKKSLEERVVN